MRHEQYMRNKLAEDEEKLMDEHYTKQMKDTKADMVNSPLHYNQSGIECIAAIQAALGPNFKYYLQGNIMKYLWRFDYKGKPLEDLQKAQWYLNTLMEDVAASDES
jgi:hypothetical protein